MLKKVKPTLFNEEKVKSGKLKFVVSKESLLKQLKVVEAKFMKYTYQDWVDGKLLLDHENLGISSLERTRRLSTIDSDRIKQQQEAAYIKRLNDAFESLKDTFLTVYNDSFTKDRFLSTQIKQVEKFLNVWESEDEAIIYHEAVINMYPAHMLSFQDVKKYLSYTVDQVDEYGYSDYELTADFWLNERTPMVYILKSNYLKWLQWFQEQQKLTSKVEPTIPIPFSSSSNITKKDKLQKKSLDWKSLFVDSSQGEVILKLIAEHLSSTGQWLTEPKGRHLVALCSELEFKGYFKSDRVITNPVKALAFAVQFGFKQTPKNFEPNKRGDAEVYRELFKRIPHYKPTSLI